MDLVFGLVGAFREFARFEFEAEFAGRGVDTGDDDRRGGAETGPERDVAFDGDVEAGVGRVGGVAGLVDRGVDVAHRGLHERCRNVHVGPVAGRAAVLDGEAVETQVLGADADVVVVAGGDGDGRPALDRAGNRRLAVDDCVLPEQIHLAGSARNGHTPELLRDSLKGIRLRSNPAAGVERSSRWKRSGEPVSGNARWKRPQKTVFGAVGSGVDFDFVALLVVGVVEVGQFVEVVVAAADVADRRRDADEQNQPDEKPQSGRPPDSASSASSNSSLSSASNSASNSAS